MSELSVIQNNDHQLKNARKYSGEQLQLIKRTVARDCTNDEFNMFIEICRRQNLDPFRRQIYAFVFNKDDQNKRQVAYVTGIDGYRAIAKRTGTYRPAEKEPDIETDESLVSDWNPMGIVKCVVTVYQFGPDKQWHPVVGVAHWKEFAPLYEEGEWVPVIGEDGNPVLETSGKWKGRPKKEKRGTGKVKLTKDNWKNMPHVMIAKCAEAQALRKGWPEEYGGIYVSEELDQAQADQVVASEIIESYEADERLKAVHGNNHIPMIMAMSEGLEMIETNKLADSVLALLKDFESADDIEAWMEMNRVGLQQFWAAQKSDALELKKKIEELIGSKRAEVNQTKGGNNEVLNI